MEQNQLTGRLWAIGFPRGALLAGLFLLFANFLVAQQVTGTVNDNSGVGIPGVLILVKGTTKGTVTEVNGTFSIAASSNDTLAFSSTGFATVYERVGNRTQIVVTLAESVMELDEMVVTALGIRKESKKLGYATTTVGAEALTENRSSNFMNTLQPR